MTATWRLALRAVLVGLTSLLVQLQASADWDNALLRSAITGAILAAFEVLTPLNALVGVGKPDTPPPVAPRVVDYSEKPE